MLRWLFTGLLIVPFLVAAARADIEGQPEVIDGDTIAIAGQVLHLHGIDAPELGQMCERGGQEYDCGFEASNALGFITAFQWVKCQTSGQIANGTVLATCVLGGRYDVALKMVRQGWALAAGDALPEYQAAERDAQKEKLGIWAGAFTRPWEWRVRNR